MLEADRPRVERALGKLQDQYNGTQYERDVKHCFKNSASFLFRAYQQSIIRFELIVHKRLMVDAIPYASGVPQNPFRCKLLIAKMMKPERSPMHWFILFRERERAVPFSGRLHA